MVGESEINTEREELLRKTSACIAMAQKLVTCAIGAFYGAYYHQNFFKSEKDKFGQQINLAIEDVKGKHYLNLEELGALLKDLMCRMDTEVEYEKLELGLTEAEKLLLEMGQRKSLGTSVL